MKVSEGAIRKRETQENIATKPKIVEDKDTTEEKNIRIGNTFNVLQDDDQEPILEEQLLHPITKINKEEKRN